MMTTEPTGWIRSSSCSYGGDCVEVAFHKAAASSQGMNCVEVGECDCAGGTVHVRDSKLGDASPILTFTRDEFEAFKAGVRAGEFDSEVHA
jgi:hypothetical protein